MELHEYIIFHYLGRPHVVAAIWPFILFTYWSERTFINDDSVCVLCVQLYIELFLSVISIECHLSPCPKFRTDMLYRVLDDTDTLMGILCPQYHCKESGMSLSVFRIRKIVYFW